MPPEPRSATAATTAAATDETTHVAQATRVEANESIDGSDHWLAPLVAVASVLVALVPIAVSVARAVHRQWLPIGDNAFFSLRAGDVLTRHHPLLGTWTSASTSAGVNFNNPGPLFFDLVAIPQRLAPGGAGLAVGTALLNGAAVVGIACFAHRRGGPLLAAAAMAVTATLSWSMGSELLYDPWQPHSLLMPFLLFIVLVWSTSCGDRPALPWAVAVGSLIVETHLTYGLLVPVLGAWAVIGLGLDVRRRAREEPTEWGALRRRTLVALGVAGLVAALCWAQPIIEQFTGPGRGNLSRLAQGTRSSELPTAGLRLGTQLTASILSLPPWWLRPSFTHAFLPPEGGTIPGAVGVAAAEVPSTAVAVLSLGALLAILGLWWWLSRRDRDLTSSRAAITGMIAVAGALLTASRVPVSTFGVAQHQFRWLWPIGAFTVLALVAIPARRLVRRVTPLALAGTFALVTLVVAVLNLPKSNEVAGPQVDAWSIPVMRDLDAQLRQIPDRGPLLLDVRNLTFAEPFSMSIMAELQRQHVEFVIDDEVTLRQVGPSRRFNGHNADARIFYRRGDDVLTPPPGARQVARHNALSPSERAELSRLEGQARRLAEQGRVRLTQRGQAQVRAGRLPGFRDTSGGQHLNAQAVLATRALSGAVRSNFVVLDGPTGRLLRRYADLQFHWDRETVAVFAAPLTSKP